MVKDLSFTFDSEGYYTNQKCFILTGSHLHFLVGLLNSKLFRFCFEDEFPELQGNSRELNKVVFEQIPIKVPNQNQECSFELMVNFILFIRKSNDRYLQAIPNEDLSIFFEEIVNMMVYELYFEEEMKRKDIDVLQFVTEKAFPDIIKSEDPKAVIQKVYYDLQEMENPIRKRILIANSRSETIARINAANG